MPKYIDMDSALQAHPEFLNEQIDDHDKAIYAKGWNACNSAYYGSIKELPFISPDKVRGVGKWEQKEIFGVEETTIEQMQSASCSVCRKYHTTPYLYYFDKYNYCPSCGAKMEVSDDA